MHDQARTRYLGQERLRFQAKVAVRQVELEQVRLDAPLIIAEVVVAHRHAPANGQGERQLLLGLLFLQVALEQEVALGNIALGRLAQQLRQPVRR
ncbi:hypothetical protein D3C80_1726730 [compost metagenome]